MNETKIKNFIKDIEIHNKTRKDEQETDQTYFNDSFKVSIVEPFHKVRTGSGARVVANVVAHLETANPQVKREPRNKTEKSRDSAVKVERFLNYLIRNFIQEINESTWNAVLMGEGIYQIDWNSDAYEKENDDYVHRIGSLPVVMTALDPMNVFCNPYDSFLPNQVAKVYRIDKFTANQNYPDFYTADKQESFRYSVYTDSDRKAVFLEAALLEGGIKPNIYGFPNYVHFPSGYGKRSPDGRPETMAVGILRRLRGLLKEECESTSRFDSIIALYANPIGIITQTDINADPIDKQELEDTILGPGAQISPGFGYKYELYVPNVQIQQLAVHISQVRAALGLEDPPIMSGMPATGRTTGRMEDIEFQHVFKRNAKLIKNHEEALGLVLSRCLQILDTQPQALPVTFRSEVIEKGDFILKEDKITKEDIDGYYDCTVELNPDEDVEANANFMKYRMMVNEGRISWKRFLIDGLGKTEYESDEMIAEAIAEQDIMTNPQMAQMRSMEAIERMGMTRYLKKMQEQTQEKADMQTTLQNYQPKSRPSEARNPMATDILRQTLQETPNTQRKTPKMEVM